MSRRFFVILVALVLVVGACGGDTAGGGGAVSIDSPASGTQVSTGTSLTIQVTANDDAGVSRVDLQFAGQTILSITNSAGSNPFVAVQSWTPTDPGSSNLVAVAYRPDGSVIGSAQASLTITGDAVTTTTVETTTTTGTTDTTTGGTTGTTAGGTTGTTSGGTTGTTAGTTSTTAATTTTTAGAQEAPLDGDSLQNPVVKGLMTPTTNRTWTESGEISYPGGDQEDFYQFELPNDSNPSSNIHVTLDCQISGPDGAQVRAVLWENGVKSTTFVFCGNGQTTITINNTKVQILQIYFAIPKDGVYATYQLTVEHL